jgi:hypothetical protein
MATSVKNRRRLNGSSERQMLTDPQDSLKRANPNGPKWIFRGVGHAEGSKVDIGGEEYEMLCERVGSLDIENQDEEDVF